MPKIVFAKSNGFAMYSSKYVGIKCVQDKT